jgi:hypothetical protein
LARNGSGTYSLPQAPFVPGTTIASSPMNSDLSDIAAALTQSVSKDGQTPFTSNQSMGNNRLTSLADAELVTDAVNLGQVADGALNFGTATGTDTIAVTLTPGFSAYSAGQWFSFEIAETNTGAVTVNVNTIGAGALVWPNGTALAAGDLPDGALVDIEVKDATPVFHLQTVAVPPLTTARSVAGKVYVQTFTSSGTYTPHAGMVNCLIECVGGGGGGGGVNGAAANSAASGGGGAGSYSWKLATAADIGASKAVTIGALGAGGTAGANNGSAGGDTSVGSLCIGKGGSGGVAANPTGNVFNGAPGAGGVAGTGDTARAGEPGGMGMGGQNAITAWPTGGAGGSTLFGGGAASRSQIVAASDSYAGNAAPANTGGGGGGALAFNSATTKAGGDGSAGYVRITEFCDR